AAKYQDQLAADDYANARKNWSQSKALDKIDKALKTRSVVKPTPEKFIKAGESDPGYIDGLAFRKAVHDLESKGVFAKAGITPEHVKQLRNIGLLHERSGNIQKNTGGLMQVLKVAKVIHAPVKAIGAEWLLGKLMTNPEAAPGTIKVLK